MDFATFEVEVEVVVVGIDGCRLRFGQRVVKELAKWHVGMDCWSPGSKQDREKVVDLDGKNRFISVGGDQQG